MATTGAARVVKWLMPCRKPSTLAKAGRPLPPGTVLVLEIYDDNALTDYFVMEKREDWGLDFAEEDRTGDWHFQQFDPDGQVRRTASGSRSMKRRANSGPSPCSSCLK